MAFVSYHGVQVGFKRAILVKEGVVSEEHRRTVLLKWRFLGQQEKDIRLHIKQVAHDSGASQPEHVLAILISPLFEKLLQVFYKQLAKVGVGVWVDLKAKRTALTLPAGRPASKILRNKQQRLCF